MVCVSLLGEYEKDLETLNCRLVFPQHFLFLQSSALVAMTTVNKNTENKFFLENNAPKKVRKLVYFFDHQNVNFLCSHHHYAVQAVQCFYQVLV